MDPTTNVLIDLYVSFTIIDRTTKDVSQSHNGGDYTIWRDYRRVREQQFTGEKVEWIEEYKDSSDFHCCKSCGSIGSWMSSCDCDGDGNIISEDQMLQKLVDAAKKGRTVTGRRYINVPLITDKYNCLREVRE